jgi:hypothetical protein
MGHSVKITSRFLSPEEIAANLGFTKSRLKSLLALIDHDTKTGSKVRSRSASPAAKKASVKTASAKRKPAKRARTAN